jgi:hypothetical protein
MLQDRDTTEMGDSQILHPGSRQLFRYWEMLRAERPCPQREEIDLKAIEAIVPHLLIIERDHLRNGYKFRLVGTAVCALFNKELTGKSVLEGWDHFESDVISRHLQTTLNQRQPSVLRMRLTTNLGQSVAAEVLALPVQMRGSANTQILAGLFPFRSAQSLAHSSITDRELASARIIWTEHLTPMPMSQQEQQQPIRPTVRHFEVITGGRQD